MKQNPAFATSPGHFSPWTSLRSALAAALLVAGPAALAAPVSWDSPEYIAGDTDVITTGTLEYAFNCGSGTATTINGVTFAAGTVANLAASSDISVTVYNNQYTGYGSTKSPYSALSANYKTLLTAGIYDGNGTPVVTLNNLTDGEWYTIQVWVIDSRNNASYTNRFMTLTSTGGNSVVLDYAEPAGGGGLGQYATGTFQAVGTSQTFTAASATTQMNAIQVRNVPEPVVSYWTGTGGASWDAATTVNFSTNAPADALTEATFDVATALSQSATFADSYFDAGASTTVTQNTVTIAAGGVSTGHVKFTNSTLNYDISAADANGITGATDVSVSGGGTVTLSSPNTHTGTTAVSGGSMLVLTDSLALQNSTLLGADAPVFDASVLGNAFTLGGLGSDAAIALENNAGSPAAIELIVGNNNANTTNTGTLTGAGSLTKIGTGTLTLDGPNGAGNSTVVYRTFTGDTVIKEGKLIAGPGNADIGLSNVSQVYLGDTSGSADATLQFDQASSTTFPNTINYTVQTGNTGTASLNGHGNSQVKGTVTLGSAGSDGKDLNLAMVGTNAGWDFRLQGVIQDPAGMNPGTAGTVTIDSTNFGETYYEAANTYSGNTIVEAGKFIVRFGGSMTFYPTNNGITNQLMGAAPNTGAVTLNAPITIDLSGADATDGNSWVLIGSVPGDFASLTYGASFGVTSTAGTFVETVVDSGIWTLADGLYAWKFDELSGTLSYGAVQDHKLWTGIGGATWDAAATANFANNLPAGAVDNVSFATATATTMAAQFADSYWHNGSTVAVTQNNITIATGGVETGLIDFLNETLAYTVDSSDANGIMGDTALAVRGGGTVTLRGTHAYTGATTIEAGNTLNVGDGTADGSIAGSPITNNGSLTFTNPSGSVTHSASITSNGTLVFNNTGAFNMDGALSGSGTLEKQGTGTATVSLNSTLNGATTITAGTLVFQGLIGGTTYDIASGAVLELDDNGTARNYAAATLSGAGTFRKTGSAQVEWGATIANFELDSGSLIDVQGGILKGGSNANDVWTSNLSDLNVASGATFRGTEANVRVDALTGSGNIQSGFNHPSYVQFTIGVDDGDGTFGGVLQNDSFPGNFTKVGSGTQTLAGLNTYTGNTSIEEGAITLADGGQLRLVPTTNGTSNVIAGVASGTGTINLDGALFLNLNTADATSGNNWLLVDDTDLTVNYGATFGVASTLGTFLETGLDSGVWFLEDGDNEWSFDEATGTLSYGPAQNQKFWTGINGATWDADTTANFSNNIPADALASATFDVATEFAMKAKFGDSYLANGGATAVTQNTVTIAAGGVETGAIEFLNTSALDYTVDSSDTNGIMGATTVSIIGGGTVTLRGTHSYTGATTIDAGNTLNVGDGTVDGSIANSPITNNGALVFNNTGAVGQDGALSGSGSLEKLGAGTLTVTSNSSLNGGTTVTAGTLAFQGQIGSGIHDIASAAVLELNNDTAATLTYPAMTFSGAGTLRKTGVDEVNWPASIAIFDLASGALIDIQAGTLVGGNSANENWTTNLSDLHVALDGIFRGVEANVRVDVLTGEGVINSGHPDASYVQFTMGVDNGSGTFDGTLANTVSPGNFTKVGSGTQTLTGVNTYTGNTSIEEGAIILADGGQLTFVPAADTVTNQIAGVAGGTESVTLNGALYLNLGSANTTPGNSWVLVDDTDLSVTYGGTFGVNSSLGAFTGSAGVWTRADGVNMWTFTEATGTLTVGLSIYGTWTDSFSLSGADALTSADVETPTPDGNDNLLEFGFGTDPTLSDAGALNWNGTTLVPGQPVIDYSGFGMVKGQFVQRANDVGESGSVRYRVELSADMDTWETSDTATWATTPAAVDPMATVPGYELVEIIFPFQLNNGRKPRFFRVSVIEVH